jgi:uncharacterized protein YndB with AHSA1/START domain
MKKHDLTVGGEVTYVMTGPGGETSRGWWRVTSVDPPRSLEFTDGFASAGGGTRMRLRLIFDSSEHMEQLERWGAFEVFPQSVGQMDALLAADSKTGGTQHRIAGFQT